ncbi:MAG: metal-dependent hydrolase [Patescibacteria group bacterium]|nr:metal-dependent hydrolase [Patescibacteria group bacterium]
MASFKTHISFGIILGIVAMVAVLFYTSLASGFLFSVLFFLAIVLGSFLPDFDSDESMPFQIVFGLAALVSAAIILIYFYKQDPHNFKFLIGAPLAVFIFVRFILGAIFKKFTHHRGIFHSLPMMGAAALSALLIFSQFNFSPREKILLAGGVGLGFLGHLILDELKSATRFRGIFLIPSHSLGSALKLVSRSRIATVFLYLILAVLIGSNWPILKQF